MGETGLRTWRGGGLLTLLDLLLKRLTLLVVPGCKWLTSRTSWEYGSLPPLHPPTVIFGHIMMPAPR